MAQTVRTVAEATLVVTLDGALAPYPLCVAVEALAEAFGEDAIRHRSDILMAICASAPMEPGAYAVRLEEQRQVPWRDLSRRAPFRDCSITVLQSKEGSVVRSVRLVDAQEAAQGKRGKIVNFFS